MAERSIIDTMARAMYLQDATRTIRARGGSAVPTPAWYDEYAAMPVTGKGFVEEWEGHARAALRSLLEAGPTEAMLGCSEVRLLGRSLDDDGIDMDRLGRLCREEPDEAAKREVAEMMDGLTGRIGAQP